MQELYFQQLKNRDVGPLSANQVRQMIRAGQIQPSDKLRVDGEALAHPAQEFLAFRDEIERTTAQEANGRRWVCMRARQMTTGSTSAMCGPYTRKEIVSLLMRGELSASDYVWREGFTSWKTLASVDQLQLPIPNFPQKLISWNSGALDWRASAAPMTMPAPRLAGKSIVDYALDAATVLACGLFAVVVWKLVHHAPHAKRPAARPAAHATTRPAAAPKAPAVKAPVPKRAPARSTI